MVPRPKFPFRSNPEQLLCRSSTKTGGGCPRAVACAGMFALLLVLAPPLFSEPLMLNFRNVEIRQIIESVGELTGKNFLIDPRVRGKVTIIANEEVPEDALYDVMLSILRMHGFRAVEGENLTRILPGNIASRYRPEFLDGSPSGESEKLVTTILQIRHLSAASIVSMIKPLMSAQAQVLVHKETNSLLVTEINSNLARVTRIISKIDVEDLSDFEIIQLDYANAKDIVGLVQRSSNKNLRHLMQVVADQNGNRVILTGPRKVRRSLRALIAELDSETSTDVSGRIKVIKLHYARVDDVIKIVKGLLSSAEFIKTLGGEGEYDTEQPVATKKTSDKKGDKKKEEKKKEEKKKEEKKKATTKRNYVIQADTALNALIVGGPPQVIAAVERVVREIDVPRPQVLIEAIFADTTETKKLEIESQFMGGKPTVSGRDLPGPESPGVGAAFSEDGVFSGTVRANLLIDGNVLSWILTVLNTDDDSRVLSTPSILTLNNEEAMIDVSDVVSIQTGQTRTQGAGPVSTMDFARQAFGTTLKVKPQITEGDAVRLDIEYKTEDVLGTSTTAGRDPDSRKREIKTTVLVNDGDVLVLGGLANKQATENESKVPLLSSIPIVGHLFRSRNSVRNKTTLMVFIRPTILRNADEGSELSSDRYAELRLEQLMDARSADTLLPSEDPMVLPGLQVPRTDEGLENKRRKRIRDDRE